MFDGKTILITGGTGSLGKQLTKLILTQYKPKKLIIFSRDELKQFDMRKKWNDRDYPPIRYFLGDVRDRERLMRAFHGVNYVIHAAALKQVPAAEYNPSECINTNVIGAMNVIDAALHNNVERVVALSTDKACNPVNLYGATKLCSDKLFIAGNAYSSTGEKVFSVVRYGNVVGSRGSVIPYFKEKAKTGVMPITDPRMTRFWITLDQAANFVLHVLKESRGGEIFVPKIPSMKITDLATAIAPDCQQETVGIRSGEKIHELLIGRDDSRTTFEFDNHYILLPQRLFDRRQGMYPGARKCSDQFEYSSGTNPWFMKISDLRELVDSIGEDYTETYTPTLEHPLPEHKSLSGEIESSAPNPIPYAKQCIDDEDVEAVTGVVRSDYIARGPEVEKFEDALKEEIGASHAVALSSGTAGLHIACIAAGVGRGDEVITSPITFVASANAALYCGATPVFADIDPKTYNIDPVQIEQKITERTRAIIPVHFAGQSCEMDRIREIVRAAERRYGHKIWIIEDACHVISSAYKGERIGVCRWSDMCVMSFHPVKHITSAEGGVVFTSSHELAEKLRRLRGHGITRDANLMEANHGPWYHEQIDLGYNYFITDIQCALGTSQLEKVSKFSETRHRVVRRYNEAFAGMRFLKIPFQSSDAHSTLHLYVPRIDFAAAGTTRAAFMARLREKGVCAQVHYIPVHLQPYFRKHLGTKRGDHPQAEAYYEQCLSLPLHQSMTQQDADRVIAAVKEALESSLPTNEAKLDSVFRSPTSPYEQRFR